MLQLSSEPVSKTTTKVDMLFGKETDKPIKNRKNKVLFLSWSRKNLFDKSSPISNASGWRFRKPLTFSRYLSV